MSNDRERRSMADENCKAVEPLVAWEVVIDDMTCIVFATTKPKARWIAVNGYWEAGFGRRGQWPSARAARAERHDTSPLRDRGPRCWTPSHVEELRP